jgi:hypothetical protein
MQLKIVLWNDNGLAQHTEEVKNYIQTHQIDILLISESHFTTKNYFKIPNYKIYDTQHPDGTACGGTAVIIKTGIKNNLHDHYNLDHLQATSVVIEDWIGPLTLVAVYCPPKYNTKAEQYQRFFDILGQRFLAGGDYNAKHPQWGSRLTTPRGRELLKAIQAKQLSHVSTGEPTYWPSDRRRVPDLLDFGVVKCIPLHTLYAKSSLELSSDHSPVIIAIHSQILPQPCPPTLSTKHTNWETFRTIIRKNLSFDVPLKTDGNIEEYVYQFVHIIQQAAWSSTPTSHRTYQVNKCAPRIKQKILDRRKLRKNGKPPGHRRIKQYSTRRHKN